MGKGVRAWLLATSVMGLMCAQAPAEERAAETDEIVVTAAGYEQRIMQAPASIRVLGREDIEENRATSAEALAGVEGVDAGAAVGKTGGLTINIRDMGSDYTLVLVDGRRQNTAGSVTLNGFGENLSELLAAGLGDRTH